MEDAHIGDHCSVSNCRQRTYLPINCNTCTKLFCSDHAIHDCVVSLPTEEVLTAIQCSRCSKASIAKCEVCSALVCASHRFHECQEEPRAAPQTVKPALKKVFRAPDTKPTNPTAIKLLKMRVKARAVGDPAIPTENRFAIRFECEEGTFPQELFIADFQHFGIAIDRAAAQGGITRAQFVVFDPASGAELSPSRTPVQLGLEMGQTVTLSRLV